MTEWYLHSERMYGLKKITDTELGRTNDAKNTGLGYGSGQTHIGLTADVFTFLPACLDQRILPAKMFYKDRFYDTYIKWKWIKDASKRSDIAVVDPITKDTVYLRSPAITKGQQNEPITVTSTIVGEAKYESSAWYLVYFGLKDGTPVFVPLREGTRIFDHAVKIGLIGNLKVKQGHCMDNAFYRLLDYINEQSEIKIIK